jgi:hypothetical protein
MRRVAEGGSVQSTLLSAKYGGLNCDAIPEDDVLDVRADLDDSASGFVSEHQWLSNEVCTHTTMGVHVELCMYSAPKEYRRRSEALTSLPHIPVASTWTSTSSSPTVGIGFSLISTVIAFNSVHALLVGVADIELSIDGGNTMRRVRGSVGRMGPCDGAFVVWK